ncbi:DUF1932 domain-containing protein [Methylobacterium sp. JK268]
MIRATAPTIAVIAPGAMGSAVAHRLCERGARILTSLAGRGEATVARARAAGMRDASDAEIAAEAEILLSIVPPAEAAALAARFAPAIAAAGRPLVFADCNAIGVETVREIGGTIAGAGGRFADGGIIGLPPKPGEAGPVLYLSGPAAPDLALLSDLGLRVRIMDAPIGAASALKLSYAGITKGLTAVASAMVLAAERAGAGPALRAELAESQPQLLTRFTKALPDMVPKAYRWVAEMEAIRGFIGEERPEAAIFTGAAGLYERLARDHREGGVEIAAIDAFLNRDG